MTPRATPPPMGASVFLDLLRRVDAAVTLSELRALRGFVRGRLEHDDRLASFDEAVDLRAKAMVAEAEAAARSAEG